MQILNTNIIGKRRRSTFKRKASFRDVVSDTESSELSSDLSMEDLRKSTNLYKSMNTRQFKLIMVLGSGRLGKVFLAKDEDNNLYAMKRIRKDQIVKNDAVEQLLTERKILTNIKHPFIMNIEYVNQSEDRYYFFFEYMKGGTLAHQLALTKTGFDLTQVKCFAAQIILALGALHANDFVHKDLTPQSIYVDEDGYVRIGEFGTARELKDTDADEFKAGGTLEYVAPEAMNPEDEYCNTYQIDWWSLGVLLYELHYGKVPFNDPNDERLVDKILAGEFSFPEDKPKERGKNYKWFKDLITNLLITKPKNRLGFR